MKYRRIRFGFVHGLLRPTSYRPFFFFRIFSFLFSPFLFLKKRTVVGVSPPYLFPDYVAVLAAAVEAPAVDALELLSFFLVLLLLILLILLVLLSLGLLFRIRLTLLWHLLLVLSFLLFGDRLLYLLMWHILCWYGRVADFNPLFTTSVNSPRLFGSFVIVSVTVVSLLVDGWGGCAGLFPG